MTENPGQSLPLHDIHLPDAISWWPPAPGWWMLLATLIMLGFLGWFLLRRYKRGALRREALAQLQRIEAGFRADGDHVALARELSALLRRIAISTKKRDTVAGLTGDAWLRFLDEFNGDADKRSVAPFQQGAGRILVTAPYSPAVDAAAIQELLTICRDWLTKARL